MLANSERFWFTVCMAKIKARGATEVARLATTFDSEDFESPVPYLWVLRSDGVVLRRVTGEFGSGYKVFGRIDRVVTAKAEGEAALTRIATRRGHEVKR